MGLHICFIKDSKDHHPDWDYLRQGGDNQFPALIDWSKIEYKNSDQEEWRPTNIPELRDKINATDWPGKDRYLHLLDLVEKTPDYWLYFSY